MESCPHAFTCPQSPTIGRYRHSGDRYAEQKSVGSLSVTEAIQTQAAAGIAPSNVMATLLHADSNTLMLPKDIADAKHANRREELSSNTPTTALFGKLADHGFFYKHDLDSENRLHYLFWAHPR